MHPFLPKLLADAGHAQHPVAAWNPAEIQRPGDAAATATP
jgi:hypothetical protein